MVKFVQLNDGTVIRADRIAWMKRSEKHEFDYDVWEETETARQKLGTAYESEVGHLWDNSAVIPDTSGSVVYLFLEFSDEKNRDRYEEFCLPVLAWRVEPRREDFAEAHPVTAMSLDNELCEAVLELRRDGKPTVWVGLKKGRVEYDTTTFPSLAHARKNYHEGMGAKHGDRLFLTEEQQKEAGNV